MRNPNQPDSEFEATQRDSSDPFTAPTAASEREYSRETDETRSNRPLPFANYTQRLTGPIAHESGISYSFTEIEENFLYPEKQRHYRRFSSPVEFYETDAALSSSCSVGLMTTLYANKEKTVL